MNYLAHLALSGAEEEVIMGNYSGDFFKGRLSGKRVENLPDRYVTGLRLHRLIDEFTDGHAVVREARSVLHLSLGRSAGVAIDILFDHYLALDFEKYHAGKLPDFAGRMYEIIRHNDRLIPLEMRPFSEALVHNKWLVQYAYFDGLDRTFRSMKRRYPFLDSLDGAVDALRENYLFYHGCFSQFYPELKERTTNFLTEHGSSA